MQLLIQRKNLKGHRLVIDNFLLFDPVVLSYTVIAYNIRQVFLVFVLLILCQRDLPIGIIGSLFVCIALYIGVCSVITGMVPYKFLGEDAPLAEAFKSKGLHFVSVLISVGAVAGLTTTLLVGLYVQVTMCNVEVAILAGRVGWVIGHNAFGSKQGYFRFKCVRLG